jgi:hypothetical protein
VHQIIPSTYERLTLKKLNYWLFWPLLGVIGFLLGELLINIFADRHFLITQLLFGLGVGILPLSFIGFSHSLQKVILQISRFFWDDEDEFLDWLENRIQRCFTLRFWPSRLVTGSVIVLGSGTVLFLGLPFKTTLLNILAYIGFSFVLIICGQIMYMISDSLIILRELINRPIKIPFYFLPHPAINELQNHYMMLSFFTIVTYIILVISIWQGPYGINIEMQVWLTVLAIYPISILFWVFSSVHKLMKRIKFANIEIINAKIQIALHTISEKKEIEVLDSLMDVQRKVQSLPEWTINISGGVTFIISVLTLIAQIMITVQEFISP